MFLHVFKYRLLNAFRGKTRVFWMIFFPMILTTFFHLAFSNLTSGENLGKISIALVEADEMPEAFKAAVNESGMFEIFKAADADEAEELLAQGDVSGYVEYDAKIRLTVLTSGLEESITKEFLDRYAQINAGIAELAIRNPELLQSGYFEDAPAYSEDYTVEKSVNAVSDASDASLNYVVIYFYTVIAMTCLMTSEAGIDDITAIQANQSGCAVRNNVSPTGKFKIFMGYSLSGILFGFISVLIVLIYTSYVLKVDYGNSMGYVILMCLAGCIAGEFLGTMIGVITKKPQGIKSAVSLAIVMGGCFLSGMMVLDMKYIVQNKFPAAAYINPANLITDGLYSLYYYEGHERYFMNLGILMIIALIFAAVTYMVLRRQRYASI